MELREKLSNFGYYNKNDFHCSTQSLVVSPKAPFNWKWLPIGIVSVEGIWKNVPNLQVVGSCPVPPMPPVVRIVLLQYRGNGLTLLQLHCRLPSSNKAKRFHEFVQRKIQFPVVECGVWRMSRRIRPEMVFFKALGSRKGLWYFLLWWLFLFQSI